MSIPKKESVLLKTNKDNGRKLYKVVGVKKQNTYGYEVVVPGRTTKADKVYYYGPNSPEQGDYWYKRAMERYKG